MRGLDIERSVRAEISGLSESIVCDGNEVWYKRQDDVRVDAEAFAAAVDAILAGVEVVEFGDGNRLERLETLECGTKVAFCIGNHRRVTYTVRHDDMADLGDLLAAVGL